MHIPDGFLPPNICLAGYALTGGVTWYSLREIKRDNYTQANIPKASLLTAAFFVASLIHIPIPPTSVHLIFNGLMGAVLGFYAFPAILIGLFFQAVMFQHGGMSTLGVNAIVIGAPAIAAHLIFKQRDKLPLASDRFLRKKQAVTKILSFAAGAGALLLSATMFAVLLVTNISPDMDVNAERTAILISMGSYAIQAAIEGVFCVMLISFLEQVKPELLRSSSNNY
ncbi:cobalt transporter CbiM [Waterburya agarophytonicola K14]|uniref:Cobalt transporter CbiM n=1 Tax=Waterburya agarophytonicola KI4 TaxID=2874699 RepID=A0A964BQ00_9CYAN|nr:cobalt transporter CbiM [Waterburya agarophytonicola]MCC0177270.1 cobalt transporter CbiM [Waterburya agarophytonicola KI4]